MQFNIKKKINATHNTLSFYLYISLLQLMKHFYWRKTRQKKLPPVKNFNIQRRRIKEYGKPDELRQMSWHKTSKSGWAKENENAI